MKIITFLFFTLIVLGHSSLFAQHKTRIGFEAGLNRAMQTIDPAYYDQKSISSLHLTGILDFPLYKNLHLQTGLSLQGKGVKTLTGDMQDGPSSGTLNMMYLELPVKALWKFPVKNLGMLVAGAGPYVAVGLGGQETYTGGAKRENIFQKDGGSGGYSSGDFGMNFQLGTELKSKITIRLQQGFGLFNIAPSPYTSVGPWNPIPSSRSTIKNRVSSLSLGYLF